MVDHGELGGAPVLAGVFFVAGEGEGFELGSFAVVVVDFLVAVFGLVDPGDLLGVA